MTGQLRPNEGGHLHICSAAANVQNWKIPATARRIGSTILKVTRVKRQRRKKERKCTRSAVNPTRLAMIPAAWPNWVRLVSLKFLSVGLRAVVWA